MSKPEPGSSLVFKGASETPISNEHSGDSKLTAARPPALEAKSVLSALVTWERRWPRTSRPPDGG